MCDIKVEERNKCRFCSGILEPVINLKEVSVDAEWDKGDDGSLVPVVLSTCEYCNLLQSHYDLDIGFHNLEYEYEEKNSPPSYLDIYNRLLQREIVTPGSAILELNANTEIISNLYDNKVIKRWWDLDDKDIEYDVIFLLDVLDQIDDPQEFLESIKYLLSQNGLLVIQVTDLMSIISSNSIDSINPYRRIYFTLDYLATLLKSYNLDIVEVFYNNVGGGKLVIFAGHDLRHRIESSFRGSMLTEKSYFESMSNYISVFQSQVNYQIDVLEDHISKLNDWGFITLGMGFNYRASVLLQYCDLDPSLLPAIGTEFSEFWGKRVAGTNIKIISEDAVLELEPDAFLILPYYHRNYFISRFEPFIRSGKIAIIPLPKAIGVK